MWVQEHELVPLLLYDQKWFPDLPKYLDATATSEPRQFHANLAAPVRRLLLSQL
jgi:hypothetical protein